MNDKNTFQVAPVKLANNLRGERPYRISVDQLIRPEKEAANALAGMFGSQKRATPTEQEKLFLNQEQDYLQKQEEEIKLLASYQPLEAWSQTRAKLLANIHYHPVVAALRIAYGEHRPISLSPDMIWLMICQGVGHHINAQSETLRPKLVQHQGQKTLNVRRDDFYKGAADNPWPEVFTEFSTQIRSHIGPIHDLFVADFTTTGPVERAASEVVLMHAMKKFFHFALTSIICGIPQITLEGTPADWQSILDRVEGFSVLELDWWLESLCPILEQFVQAARGEVDRPFWQSIYRIYRPNRSCASESALGWIGLFFPYLNDKNGWPTIQNPWLMGQRDLASLLSEPEPGAKQSTTFAWHQEDLDSGIYESQFPNGVAPTPFKWQITDPMGNLIEQYDMELFAGFVGVSQDAKDMTLRPEIGWAVREAPILPT